MDTYVLLFFLPFRQFGIDLLFISRLVMVATIIFVAAFKSSVSLSNAYGYVNIPYRPFETNFVSLLYSSSLSDRFAVATVMFTTTVLVSFQIKLVKRKPLWLALAFFVPFSFFDGIYWAAALKKVPEGAWVPLMIGCILCVIDLNVLNSAFR